MHPLDLHAKSHFTSMRPSLNRASIAGLIDSTSLRLPTGHLSLGKFTRGVSCPAPQSIKCQFGVFGCINALSACHRLANSAAMHTSSSHWHTRTINTWRTLAICLCKQAQVHVYICLLIMLRMNSFSPRGAISSHGSQSQATGHHR